MEELEIKLESYVNSNSENHNRAEVFEANFNSVLEELTNLKVHSRSLEDDKSELIKLINSWTDKFQDSELRVNELTASLADSKKEASSLKESLFDSKQSLLTASEKYEGMETNYKNSILAGSKLIGAILDNPNSLSIKEEDYDSFCQLMGIFSINSPLSNQESESKLKENIDRGIYIDKIICHEVDPLINPNIFVKFGNFENFLHYETR